MKIYKTQAEVNGDIKKGNLIIDDDVKFECSISVSVSITAGNINAGNITAWDITARDINAGDISARDISANDISARDISARMLTYYAVAFAYKSMTVESIKGRR